MISKCFFTYLLFMDYYVFNMNQISAHSAHICLNNQSVLFLFCTLGPVLHPDTVWAVLTQSLPSPEPVNRLHFQSASHSSVTTFLNKSNRVTREAYFSSLLSGLISPTPLRCPVNGSFCQHKAQTRTLIVLMCYFLLESPLRNGACWLTLEEKLGSQRSQTGHGFT